MRILTRRRFAVALGGAAAWPLAAHGQPAGMPVMGILGSTTEDGYSDRLAALMQGLKEAGFVEGRNIAIEARWANGDYGRLPDMAADMVRRRVSLIATLGNNLPPRAAKAATSTIPIVFVMGADPVQLGLV